MLKAETTDATPTELLIDGNVGVILEGNKMNSFRIMVVAKCDDNSEGAAYEFKGLIKKDIQPSSTAIIGSVSKTVIVVSGSVRDVNFSADTYYGSLKLLVTGLSYKIIIWSAFVELLEIG